MKTQPAPSQIILESAQPDAGGIINTKTEIHSSLIQIKSTLQNMDKRLENLEDHRQDLKDLITVLPKAISDNITNLEKVEPPKAVVAPLLLLIDKGIEELDRNRKDLKETLDELPEIISRIVSDKLGNAEPTQDAVNKCEIDQLIEDYRADVDEAENDNRVEFLFGDINWQHINTKLEDASIPFIALRDTPFMDLNMEDIDNNTSYTHLLGNRQAAYYGPYPYKYPGAYHYERDMALNSELLSIFNSIRDAFPGTNINSAMVHRYSDEKACIPLHCDNEQELDSDSPIITLSIGDTREMEFQEIDPPKLSVSIPVKNGDIVFMSAKSQKLYKHGIPVSETHKFCRLSITFRNIKPPQPAPIPAYASGFPPNSENGQNTNITANNSSLLNPISNTTVAHTTTPTANSIINNSHRDMLTNNSNPATNVRLSNYDYSNRSGNINQQSYADLAGNSSGTAINTTNTYTNNQRRSTGTHSNRTQGVPAQRSRNCLIIHDSLLNLFDKERFYRKAEKELLRAQTLENLNNPVFRRRVRSYQGLDTIIIHLGINDLKNSSARSVIEELRGSLLHLLQTTAAKILFSLVLPTGRDTHLNNRITEFNGLAVDLIDSLRKNIWIRGRLSTILNGGFTRYAFEDIQNLYDPDKIHLNERGISKLCWYFKSRLDTIYFPTLQPTQRIERN